MMDPVILLYSIFFLLLLVIFLLLLAIFVLAKRKSDPASQSDLVLLAEGKSQSILARAIKQANRILVSSELKGIRLIAQEKLAGSGLLHEYEARLADLEKHLVEELDKKTTELVGRYERAIGSLEAAIEKELTEQSQLFDKQQATVAGAISRQNELWLNSSNQVIEEARASLSKLLSATESQVKVELNGQLEAVNLEIESYKQHRMRIIDERIIDVLQDILNVTLWKKIDLKDQSDLVYRALEEAKSENAFGVVKK